ncbi:peptidase S41 family protein [Bimuria novae-zelandiae CBS 107.79]|uniref:Peptidase S41 family protein n=1 Tax=Bimuria novae-zelandiae CBS 107.79 TaxID=1447943 RepID=A0A6A5UX96_9PLEO|nr:peptidase S41 family protein [Bimuria novae-zelandiae CBS 107.79]
MRSIAALSGLLSVATAQIEPSSFRTSATADGNQPTSTASVSGPIETGAACAQIAKLVYETVIIEAELAFACLNSVPIKTDAATDTLKSLKSMVEWQSTLSYLKNPPEGYADEAVDLQKGLDDIGTKVSNGDYDNEYDFEIDIAKLLAKAHDGHLTFSGMAHAGVFNWRRDREIALISGSEDGKSKPKIWGIGDFNQTFSGDVKRSAISKIDGKEAVQFVKDESMDTSYHDPDSRYNSMFYMQPAENYGFFANPPFYPGPSVNISYENGTSREFGNIAVIVEPNRWTKITSGEDFYNTFIVPKPHLTKHKKRSSPHNVPRNLEYPREAELDRRWTPWAYPTTVVEHKAADVKLAGYFVDTGVGKVGVLMVQTFNVEAGDGNNDEAREFQAVVQSYIDQAKAQKIEKHIIDIRTNGGGKILLGYDMFLQFFPKEKPQLQSRWRGHKGSELFGEKLSSIQIMNDTNGNLYTSPFNYHSYIDAQDEAFSDFKDMYPPEKFNDDSFTALLKYNLSDPIETSSDKYSIGITMTGYLGRDNFTESPFKTENILILSDGICASTCTLFTELMTQQAGVKSLAVGGLPNSGPMQVVGGTKGSMLLSSDYLIPLSTNVIDTFAKDAKEKSEWRDILPQPFPIAVSSAGVNFQDNIRKGLEKDGMPTQFLYDTASCRIYYEPKMYLNVSSLWSKAAEVAWGKDGGMDEDACVAGSVTSKEEQSGKGPTSPSSSGNGDSGTNAGSGSDTGDGSGSRSGSNNGGAQSPAGAEGAAPGAIRPAQGGWRAILACTAVILASIAFGAGLV